MRNRFKGLDMIERGPEEQLREVRDIVQESRTSFHSSSGTLSIRSRPLNLFLTSAGLEETQAGIKIAGRNINNLRYADDTTLMAISEEELKSLLMKVKVESEKVGLKLNIQ